jgi:hypothetical protein
MAINALRSLKTQSLAFFAEGNAKINSVDKQKRHLRQSLSAESKAQL